MTGRADGAPNQVPGTVPVCTPPGAANFATVELKVAISDEGSSSRTTTPEFRVAEFLALAATRCPFGPVGIFGEDTSKTERATASARTPTIHATPATLSATFLSEILATLSGYPVTKGPDETGTNASIAPDVLIGAMGATEAAVVGEGESMT
jgi:hypothetical protein